jgi:putative ABC transport system ATP-binding protein
VTILSLKHIVYTHEKNKVTVLDDITADFEAGKVYVILGKSTEKSTLLALLAGIDTVSKGTIMYKNQNFQKIDRDRYRRTEVGTIFQQYNLIPEASALMMFKLLSWKQGNDTERFLSCLKKVGVDEKQANKKIKNLSFTNQQRVCLAKAVLNNPEIIILDAPEITLNHLSLEAVMTYLRMYAKNENKCVIIGSQSNEVAACADELWGLNGGKLSFIKDNTKNDGS